MREWLNRTVSKTVEPFAVPWVRIPPFPLTRYLFLRVQDHIGLISWSLIDKGLYILYGFVLIVIMNRTDLPEFGLYSLLIGLHTWIFTISDSFALQSLIQFGMNEKNRSKVNLIALFTHLSLTLGVSLVLFLLRVPLSHLFNEPRIEDIAAFLPILTLAFIPRTFCQKIIYRIQNMFYLFLTNLLFFGVITIFVLIGISNGGRLNFGSLSYYYLYGSIASSIMALILTYKHISFSRTGEIGWRKIYEFSWKMTLANVMYSLPRQLDVYFIKLFFNLYYVGLYSAAKNIFRVFDEALGAANGLIYPAAVRFKEKNKENEYKELSRKSLSILFISFTILAILLYFFLADFLFEIFLPKTYIASLYFFKILLIGAIFLPFQMLFLFIIAQNKLNKILIYYTIGLFTFISFFLIIGFFKSIYLIPYALVIYYCIMSLLVYYDSVRNLKLTFTDLFSFFFDFRRYLKKI